MSSSKACNFELAKTAGLPIERFPETNQEKDAVTDLLAKELERLSLDEHEKILFDVHGIAQAEEEDQQRIESKLVELEAELEKITDKPALDEARSRNEQYVGGRDFRLMFLRGNEFDARAAAEMMVGHFEFKRKLFGDGDILGRAVRQSDLTAQDKVILESGVYQVVPSRDATGRTIVCMISEPVPRYPMSLWGDECEFRAIWYILMSAIADEETQKSGIVLLLINLNSTKVPLDYYRAMNEILCAVPQNAVGAHYCYNDPSLHPYVAGFHLFASDHDRHRLRSHFGSREEICFNLQTFGIPTDDLATRIDGSFAVEPHLAWLAMLQEREQNGCARRTGTTDDESILIPRKFDVLFGKSCKLREHTGTLRALHLVEMYFEKYEKLSKFQKTDVADHIISAIHESGGRFLKREHLGGWTQVSDSEARKKVAHWFRHARFKRARFSGDDADVLRENSDTVEAKSKSVTPCIGNGTGEKQ